MSPASATPRGHERDPSVVRTSDAEGASRRAGLCPDRAFMARALEQARLGALRGEVPVGAVVAHGGSIVAEAHNRTVSDSDPTAHAEIVALRRAASRLGEWRLLDTTLYVTLEPCAMCAGAIILARVPRLVFGALDPKAGMVRSLGRLLDDPRLNHAADVTEGVLAAPAGDLLRAFFQERR